MDEPIAVLNALRASTADLVQGVAAEGWGDDDVRAPSRCTGWTRAHVLTHLARNADGISATLAGALRGEIVPRYPDGATGRDADIEAGAGRTPADLVDDVQTACERLDRMFGAIADAGAWDRPTDGDRPAGTWVRNRFVEVEIHHVDLAGSYTPDHWPPLLVAELLPELAGELGARTSESLRLRVTEAVATELAGATWTVGEGPATPVEAPDQQLLAWLTGRTDDASGLPVLTPWR